MPEGGLDKRCLWLIVRPEVRPAQGSDEARRFISSRLAVWRGLPAEYRCVE